MPVKKVVGESPVGSFGILPKHIELNNRIETADPKDSIWERMNSILRSVLKDFKENNADAGNTE